MKRFFTFSIMGQINKGLTAWLNISQNLTRRLLVYFLFNLIFQKVIKLINTINWSLFWQNLFLKAKNFQYCYLHMQCSLANMVLQDFMNTTHHKQDLPNSIQVIPMDQISTCQKETLENISILYISEIF